MLYGGKRYKHGETFEAKDEHARLLILVGSAARDDAPAPERKPAEVKRTAPEVKRPAPMVERQAENVERPEPEPEPVEPPATAPLPDAPEPDAVPDQAPPLMPRPRGRPRKDAPPRAVQPTSTGSMRRTYTRRDLKAEE